MTAHTSCLLGCKIRQKLLLPPPMNNNTVHNGCQHCYHEETSKRGEYPQKDAKEGGVTYNTKAGLRLIRHSMCALRYVHGRESQLVKQSKGKRRERK